MTSNLEDEDLLHQGRPAKPPSRQWANILLSCLLVVSCALFGYVVHPDKGLSCPHTKPSCPATPGTDKPSHNDLNGHPPPTILTCGNFSAEARSHGCVFDLLTNNWMPAYCADPTPDDEYRAWALKPTRDLGAFAFFHDQEAQVHISTEEHLSDLPYYMKILAKTPWDIKCMPDSVRTRNWPSLDDCGPDNDQRLPMPCDEAHVQLQDRSASGPQTV
ncbi:hypothetical protein GE09DRAFT_1245151 [Coniochaeta sp. 2T2.1]|nr:hypothetical protein GE09DRAFT_1245151 [Coniochaeta sp. 2T2.1]